MQAQRGLADGDDVGSSARKRDDVRREDDATPIESATNENVMIFRRTRTP